MNGDDCLTNEEVEQSMRALGLNFLPAPQQGTWAVPFTNPQNGITTLVIVNNGLGNPGYIGASVALMQVSQGLDCVHKALSLMNGALALAKACVSGNEVAGVSALAPRHRKLFQQEMLRHAVNSALAAANFLRPILQSCLEGDGNVEDVFARRLEEMGQAGPRLAPPS